MHKIILHRNAVKFYRKANGADDLNRTGDEIMVAEDRPARFSLNRGRMHDDVRIIPVQIHGVHRPAAEQ